MPHIDPDLLVYGTVQLKYKFYYCIVEVSIKNVNMPKEL